jgi:PAS domain-containing protein
VTEDEPAVLAGAADATDPTRAEEIRLRYAVSVESSDDAIIAKTLDGVISAWNAAAERMFGYTEKEAIGQPITIIIPPELHDQEQNILRRLRAGERLEHYCPPNRIRPSLKLVGGQLSIHSERGRGTMIQALVPL